MPRPPRASRPTALVDFALDEGRPTSLAFHDPVAVHEARELSQVRGVLLAAERAALSGAWVVGYVAYEAAPAFDAALAVRPGGTLSAPLAWFGVFDAPHEVAEPQAIETPAGPWTSSTPRDAYLANVEAALEAIAAGRIYQLNYTMRLQADLPAVDLSAWYHRLRRAQRCDYAAFIDLGAHRVLSLSPELFFRRDGDRLACRPMKGTAKRGRTADEDARRAAELHDAEKGRAENLMIVDLVRNDLSRVAMPGSVRVEGLFEVERYPTLLQMTSTVRAQARPGTNLADVFAALFPCGSVTGAPKVEAMKMIASLEEEPRGIYCGAVGVVKPGGDAVFNVAIRTLQVDAARATLGVGGGIVADSRAGDEYEEALLKARFLAHAPPDFRLLETLRLEDARFPLLERHLARLATSAGYFGFACDLTRIRVALQETAAKAASGVHVVRLQLDASGAFEIGSVPFTPHAGTSPVPIALAKRPVSRHDAMLFHKTTSRAVYDEARAEAPDAFDVLLWNEEGELTEFCRGNLVLDLDGKRYTPPVDCGLLAGTKRAELLAAGLVQERVLRREDLDRAERIAFVNGLRGEIPCGRPD